MTGIQTDLLRKQLSTSLLLKLKWEKIQLRKWASDVRIELFWIRSWDILYSEFVSALDSRFDVLASENEVSINKENLKKLPTAN